MNPHPFKVMSNNDLFSHYMRNEIKNSNLMEVRMRIFSRYLCDYLELILLKGLK